MIYIKLLEKGTKPPEVKDDGKKKKKKKGDKEEKVDMGGYSKTVSVSTDSMVILCYLLKLYLSL